MILICISVYRLELASEILRGISRMTSYYARPTLIYIHDSNNILLTQAVEKIYIFNCKTIALIRI